MEVERILANRKEQYHSASQEVEDARSTLIWLEDKWNKAQAGILASKLIDKDPCPVCGSEHHPNLAHLQDDLPDEKDIKAAKEMVMAKEKHENETSRAFYEIEAKYKTVHTQKQEALEEITQVREVFKEEEVDLELTSIRNNLENKNIQLDRKSVV